MVAISTRKDDSDHLHYVPETARIDKNLARVVGIERPMHCPDCGWWDDWEESGSPYCEFCGAVHAATSDDPPKSQEAIAEARE
jgi:hypothetical protein